MERILKKDILLKPINNYIYDSLMNRNLNRYYQIGSIVGILLVIQIISGILLTINYVGTVENSFKSVDYMIREINNGWVSRTVHINVAGLIFLFIYIHIYRGLLYGSYTKEKIYPWSIGVILLLFMIITAFLGYSLVYGNMSYWAMVVITNLLTVIPKYGNEIVNYLLGGYSIGESTIRRFYSLHYLIPFIIVGLTILHLITLHDVGGSNPLGVKKMIKKGGKSEKKNKEITFHPYYTYKDTLGVIIVITILIMILLKNPYYLTHYDNYQKANELVTPTHIVPEIYFLAYFAMLRSIPNKTLGVIVLLLSILSLLIIPYIHKGLINSNYYRPISYIALSIFIYNFILLTYVGQSPVEEPYLTMGQILLGYHFIYIYILIPLLSSIETLIYIYINKRILRI